MAGWWSKRSKEASPADASASRGVSSPDTRRAAPRGEIDEALADREAQAIVAEMRAVRRSAAPAMSPAQVKALAARVSAKAYALIVRHETGGRPYFEKVYKGRAVWPEASSGVTIGFGYDLGYQDSADTFAADWSGELAARHLDILKTAIGVKATDPERGQKVEHIREIVDRCNVAGVRISWEASERVFRDVTVPRFAVLTAEALPGHEVLSPDCFGALVSLTFNRGPSYTRPHDPAIDTKDRYREMRAIRVAIVEGELDQIPGLIRAMRRLWQGTAVEGEMNRRRENEARLFEDGLAESLATILAQQTAKTEAAQALGETGLPPVDDTRRGRMAGRSIGRFRSSGINDEELEEDEPDSAGTAFPHELRRAAGSPKWAPDDKAPDYAHLTNKLPVNMRFTLRAVDLDWLAQLNAFPVEEAGATPILFGLRGCAIVNGRDNELADEVELKDQRPDHDSTRCVLGVWDRAAGRIAVFQGSTVPNANYMLKYYTSKSVGNMLPTGFYGYVVGAHTTQSSSVPGSFLLRETLARKRTVVVRRSANNLMYDRLDVVDPCEPGDNIHPTFSDDPGTYNSAGCQVVMGRGTNGNHTGHWKKFRRLAGQTTPEGRPGTGYHYMLLTGLEAMLASRARREEATNNPEVRMSLMRLRFGSKDERVSRLQRKLDVDVSGTYDVETALKVYEIQQDRWKDSCDGIFSPVLDAELKAGVFTNVPADVVVVVPAATPGPAPAPLPTQQPAPTPQPPPVAVLAPTAPPIAAPPPPVKPSVAPTVATAPPAPMAPPPVAAAAPVAAAPPKPAAEPPQQPAVAATAGQASPAQMAALQALSGKAGPAADGGARAPDGRSLASIAAAVRAAATRSREQQK